MDPFGVPLQRGINYNDDIEDDIPNDNNALFTKSFKYMNMTVSYYPMWSSKLPQKQIRSKWVNVSMVIFILCCSAFNFSYIFYQEIKIIFNPNNDTEFNDIIYNVCNSINWISFMLSRLCSIYYFYCKFNFPWNYKNDFEMNAILKIQKYHKSVYIMIIIMMISESILVTYEYLAHGLMIFIVKIIGALFVYFPTYFTFGVAAKIFLYYFLIIHQLLEEMKNENDIDIQFMKYKKIISSFQNDYHYSLRWSINFYFFAIFITSWVASYDVWHYETNNYYDYLLIPIYIPICLLFVTNASLINQQFEEYHLFIFEYGEIYMKNENYDNIMMKYNYLLQFISKYPLRVCIGSFQISYKNFAKFWIGFGAAKLLSYTVRILFA